MRSKNGGTAGLSFQANPIQDRRVRRSPSRIENTNVTWAICLVLALTLMVASGLLASGFATEAYGTPWPELVYVSTGAVLVILIVPYSLTLQESKADIQSLS